MLRKGTLGHELLSFPTASRTAAFFTPFCLLAGPRAKVHTHDAMALNQSSAFKLLFLRVFLQRQKVDGTATSRFCTADQ